MRLTLPGFLLACALLSAAAGASGGTLDNSAVAWHWRLSVGGIQPERMEDKRSGTKLDLDRECFRLLLGDGSIIKSSDFTLLEEPKVEALKPEPGSPKVARHYGGRQLVVRLAASRAHLAAEWRVILRDESSYLRQELTLCATDSDTLVNEIVLFEHLVPNAEADGVVDGSPVTAGNFFLGYEHPMAQNVVSSNGVVRCSFVRKAMLKAGESLIQSCVLGAVPPGQMRRGFLAYIERERAHPYRPFLHYNSWFDIAWDKRKFNEAESLDAIDFFARELVQKRGVRMQSFLLDDGWDDNRTLWKFHSGFPRGFAGVRDATARLDASVGVWVSPFGGYDLARALRLEYGSRQGFETNASGFSLSGTNYYQRFHEICLEMVGKYGVNMFKFDGLAAGEKASENGQTRDGDAMLRLIADLRTAKPDIYINQTIGTWPSPFWLLYVDSTYRGGADHDFCGKGSQRQQWLSFRDTQTYRNEVQRGPLYPLNSLMLHGIIYATNAARLETTQDGDFTDEVRSFFASGTQLQELYVTPRLLNRQNWDDLAAAANWSQANADVLVDTHWVGGDPGKGQVYGWASWSPRKAILALRNPDDKPATFVGDIKALLELPPGAPGVFQLRSPWKNAPGSPAVEVCSGQPHVFHLRPFELVVLESEPFPSGGSASKLLRTSSLR